MTTTATAIREALELFCAQRIVLVTPYDQAVTAHEAVFFDNAGSKVVGMLARSLGGSDAYCSEPPESWARALSAAARPDADAYLLSCANVSCFSIIARAEATLGKPLITSNQAVLWAALRAIDAPRPSGLGALMHVA